MVPARLTTKQYSTFCTHNVLWKKPFREIELLFVRLFFVFMLATLLTTTFLTSRWRHYSVLLYCAYNAAERPAITSPYSINQHVGFDNWQAVCSPSGTSWFFKCNSGWPSTLKGSLKSAMLVGQRRNLEHILTGVVSIITLICAADHTTDSSALLF